MGILHKIFGVFEERGDVDWFRMRLVAGQTYQIKGPANAMLSVILPNGDVMTFPSPFGNSLNFVAPVSGDYFLSATSQSMVGNYSITVEDVPDPIPASVNTPRSLAVGGSVAVTAAENPNSSQINDDWFGIDLVEGQSYLLSINGSLGKVYIVDGDGKVVAIEGFMGQGGAQVHFTATETGRFYAGAQTSGATAYTLILNAVADDHGDTAAGAGALAVGGSVNGLWETPGDDDAYAIDLSAGTSYSFSVQTADLTQQGSLQIFNQAGDLVWMSRTQASPTTTTFSPDADGTYYVVAGIRESNSNPAGQWSYTLASAVVASDLTDNVLTIGTLAVGGQTAGVFNTAGDRDWVKIDLVAGQSYLFTMNTPNWQGSGMALYDAQGNEVRSAGNTNFGSQLHHTAESTGTYFVAALPGQQAGTYTLSATAVADDFADNVSTTGLVVNGIMTGVFEVNNDVDWFAVNLVAGRTYASDGSIYDSTGTLMTNPNWGDVSFSPITSGTYYVAVGGGQGAYVYGIVEIYDDYRDSAETSGVARQEIVGTGNADTFVSTDRYEWFDGGAGDDLFVASAGHDFFDGGAGNDTFVAGSGNDSFDGGLGIDTVSYANASAGVVVNLLRGEGQSGPGQPYDLFSFVENVIGSAFDDVITGNSAANVITAGTGNDTLNGGGGNDGFLFGAAFNALDRVDGGAGTNDQIGLQGDYTGANALTLGANTITNVEALVVLAGFSYDIISSDGNVAAGGLLQVQATQLAAGQSLHFDGSAETDGAFRFFGGQGNDQLTGGAGNDGFYFGPGGFNGNDILNGGAGANDQLGLDGDYTITLGGNFTNIEVVVLLHGPSGTPNHFNITAASNLVAAGQTMTIFGLQVETVIGFNGSDEIDGAFRIYGGTASDALTGGGVNDWIFGGAGGDSLTGGGGADTFYYDDVGQSTAALSDAILDFATGDKIDVSGIDAIAGGANDAFSFIGSGAFTNVGGQLRAENQGGSTWLVQADTDGNGTADFQLTLLVTDAHPITAADFVV